MTRLWHGQRVHVLKTDEGHVVNATGSVVGVRMSDAAAWIRLDARLPDGSAHPFPVGDAREAYIVAWPHDCTEVKP